MVIISDLISELDAAQKIVVELVDGEKGLIDSHGFISQGTATVIQTALDAMVRRRDFIERALGALRTLEADGYPLNPVSLVEATALTEMREQLAAMEAAFAKFTDVTPTLTVALGAPATK